jgi:hypothetical protein
MPQQIWQPAAALFAVDMSTLCAPLVGGATERSGQRRRCIAVVAMATELFWAEIAWWGRVSVMRCCHNVQESIVGSPGASYRVATSSFDL